MPDYCEILRFLSQNPPELEAEKRVHASLLELLGACLRDQTSEGTVLETDSLRARNDALASMQFH